tara:strand:+ start:226 stop:447 length:222 start_codon:yes stop_codon:yes gene_type:complete
LTITQLDIIVKVGTTEISSGDNSPRSIKKTDFGIYSKGSESSKIYCHEYGTENDLTIDYLTMLFFYQLKKQTA